MSGIHRKCAKCGRTRAEDPSVTYHKFPYPGTTNITKARAWAKYCWPNDNWNSVEFLMSVHNASKVLCGRHFSESQFYDNKRQKLSKFAVPDSTEVEEMLNERINVFDQNVPQLTMPGPPTTRVPLSQFDNNQPSTGEVISTKTQMDILSMSTSCDNKENICQSATLKPLMPNVSLPQTENIHIVNVFNQNVPQLTMPGPSTTRMPVSQFDNNQPTTSGVISTRTQMEILSMSTSCDNKESQSATLKPLMPNVSLPQTETIHTQPSASVQNAPSKTSKSGKVEPHSALTKCRDILKNLNVATLAEMTPREVKLYRLCQKKLKEIRRLKVQLKNKKGINKIRAIAEDENVQKLLDLKISSSFAVLLQSQLKNCPKKPKGRRYTVEQKIMALVLYKKSPACYRLLRRMFALPCQSSLNKMLNRVPLKPGINEHVFTGLKKMSEKQTDEENIAILSFDEMSIRKHLHYDTRQDQILGFQDHGNHGRKNEIATKALVFMLSGIRKKWKQPIAFYFSHTITADRMTVILKEVLTECFNSSINVVATVCDLSTVNVKVLKTLGTTTREPYFVHCGREIVALLDSPHLLKCTRNLLMKHNVECSTDLQGKGIAKWEHIKTFHDLDKNNTNFMYAPALTESHLQPNVKQQMRVKLAAQVFSHSVTAGILAKIASNELPTEAHATATFLKKFDELFDAVNADSKDLRRGKKYSTNLTARSPHLQLFSEMRQFISSMKYVGSKTNPPSQDGWIQTLNGIERLWKNLQKLGVNSLPTRRLNQDVLENLFGCIRYNCGCNANPTIEQFVSGIKTAIISNLRHTGQRKNCEDDSATLANNFSSLLTQTANVTENVSEIIDADSIDPLLADAIEAVELGTSEGQACAYVCGFIFKKLRNNNCSDCQKSFLLESPTEEPIHIFTSFKEYNDKNALYYVNKNVITCVETMATIINDYFISNAWKVHLKKTLMIALDCVDVRFLNQCEQHMVVNKTHIKTSTFYICIKRLIVLKNREIDEDEHKKALERKMKILKNK